MPSPIVLDLGVRRSLLASSPNSQSETKGYFLKFHCENIDLIKLIFNHSTYTTHEEEYTIFPSQNIVICFAGWIYVSNIWRGQLYWERTCVIIDKQSILKKILDHILLCYNFVTTLTWQIVNSKKKVMSLNKSDIKLYSYSLHNIK